MKKEFHFSDEFGNIDEKLIEEAGKEWTGKTYAFQLYRRRLASAAAIVLICIAMAGNAGVQAAVKEFTTKIGKIFGVTKDLASYTEIINQTQTKNGVSFTLNEVILDDHKLIVSLKEVFGEEKEPHPVWLNEEKTTINGQHYQSYGSLNGSRSDPEALEENVKDPDIIMVEEYEDMTLPEGEVQVHLVLEAGKTDPQPGEEFTPVAEFVYDFMITPEELKAQTVKQELAINISDENGGKLILRNLTMNDLYCRIVASGAAQDEEWVNNYELKLRGKDSFGNPVSLDGSGFISDNEMRFETSFMGDFEPGAAIDEEDFHLSIPDKDCTYLDLQLYARKIIWKGETGSETFETDEDGDEYSVQESADTWEVYAEEENYGWEPVGEKFRINIGEEKDAASKAIIGGADEPTEILLS